ncbi:MAG TPA: hypothetical protein VKF38_02795 [Anaerolineaceae bacterium]|nr:hypothetical protein [Anaerolineaceae bacterium]
MNRIPKFWPLLLFLLIVGFGLLGLFLQSISRPENTLPKFELPKYEIVFTTTDTTGKGIISKGFIHPDGSGLIVHIPERAGGFMFSQDPSKAHLDYDNGYINSWSVDGKYLGVITNVYHGDYGYPILISQNGSIISCPNAPITASKFRAIHDETILEVKEYSEVILYDLARCQQLQTLLDISKETTDDTTIDDADLSSQGWLAVDLWGQSEKKDRIQIYSPDHKEYNINDGNGIAWSKDGEWLAYVDSKMVLYIAQKDGSNPQKLDTGVAPTLSWSPDGKWIVYAYRYNDNIYKINVATKETYKIAEGTDPDWRWNIPQ